MRKGQVQITQVDFENIRGFRRAALDLDDRPIVALVGPNNSGKSGAMRLLNWLLNELDETTLTGEAEPRDQDWETLEPARDTGRAARRLGIWVWLEDGRRRRKFNHEEGYVFLRLGLRLNPRRIFLKLGRARRGEDLSTEPLALELLRLLREHIAFSYIPSFRDASSSRFQTTLTREFRKALENQVTHKRQAGAPAPYRSVKAARKGLEEVAVELAQPVIQRIRDALPRGLVVDAKAAMTLDQDSMLDLMVQSLRLRLSTGPHDANTVEATSVGSGLQSLLDIAANSTRDDDQRFRILAIDEPEAFLHPTAQRIIARQVCSPDLADLTLVSTHSPTIIEEIGSEPIAIVRRHEFYQSAEDDGRRIEINNSLLKGPGAELMFASSVLLVEGESDRLFFENLRRRIAEVDDRGSCDQLYVLAVGSKTSFGPWLRLLSSFGPAFAYLVVADADACHDALRALADAGTLVPDEVTQAAGRSASALSGARTSDWHEFTRQLNVALEGAHLPVRFLRGDLEYAALGNAGDEVLGQLAKKAGLQFSSRDSLLKKLGSKGVDTKPAADPVKSPWLRGLAAETIKSNEISPDVRAVLTSWMTPQMPLSRATGLINKGLA